MPNCRKCDAEIEWAITSKNGKPIPLDVGRHRAQPNLVISGSRATQHGMTPVVSVVKPGEGERVSHWATCPEAEAFRR
jgi:hypothetical protein